MNKLDNLSDEIEQGFSSANPFSKNITPTGNNLDDSFAIYFETRKKYHQLNILKEKLPSL